MLYPVSYRDQWSYTGLALELKTPSGKGVLSSKQEAFLTRHFSLRSAGYKTIVNNDYDIIIRTIEEYCRGIIRVVCPYCPRLFESADTLHSHEMHFYGIKIYKA